MALLRMSLRAFPFLFLVSWGMIYVYLFFWSRALRALMNLPISSRTLFYSFLGMILYGCLIYIIGRTSVLLLLSEFNSIFAWYILGESILLMGSLLMFLGLQLNFISPFTQIIALFTMIIIVFFNIFSDPTTSDNVYIGKIFFGIIFILGGLLMLNRVLVDRNFTRESLAPDSFELH
jgi:ABC-type multidrug transport system fused ATPase/permease subunit